MPRITLFADVAALALLAAAPVLAQADMETRSLIERLRPQPGGVNRGIRLPAEGNATPAAPGKRVAAAPAASETTAPADVPAVSLTVNFVLGSAQLTPEAERALAPLGRALASADLAAYRFRIEGHTDTVGDPALNDALSTRRALAVRDHLVQHYGVSAARLEALGFGQRQLLVATPPGTNEARNRRVQVLNIGG